MASLKPDPASDSYRSWLPRLTRKVMLDLQLWMIGFGLLIGLAFPFVLLLLGVRRRLVQDPGRFC